ncbi:DUF3383 family protein [Pseudomonas sp. dw_358]|uniref:DUF3383 family protein n=1 Tax=Pseudomonas sp. dw_358 TaxID=2720083 RepID=UPI001BD1F30A|nr:DUF3383 family protein [Pseudomonas sp. dw_358]
MAVDISNIVPISVSISAAGLSDADFTSSVAFADSSDLASGVVFAAGSYRDYTALTDIVSDFGTTSELYKLAAPYFANKTRSPTFTVFMKSSSGEDPTTAANQLAASGIWRYNHFFKNTDITTGTISNLAAWADSENRAVWLSISDAAVVTQGSTTDLASVIAGLNPRHIFQGFRAPATLAADATQGYPMNGLAAKFTKWNPAGLNTAITGEYQTLTNVTADSLSPTAIGILKTKKCVYFSKVVSSGATTGCMSMNTTSPSPNGEWIDDVIGVDMLTNALQVGLFDWLIQPQTKRGLDAKNFAGAIAAAGAVCKSYFDNGFLGAGYITDPDTGNDRYLSNGYYIDNDPTDVESLTTAQRQARTYPVLNIYVLRDGAAHFIPVSLYVE